MSARVLVFVAAASIISAASAIQPDPIYRETIVRHARQRIAGEKFDPQETDPQLRAAFAAADAAAERRIGNVKRDDRFVFRFWSEKQKILQQKFGIAWNTPAELNPQITYGSYGQPQITNRERADITRVVRKHTARPITSIERDFRGKVTVWTRPAAHDESLAYIVHFERGRWKIVDVERWMP